MNKKKLILIQMNEVNFQVFEKKIKKFKFFSKILNLKKVDTFSEKEYELLEPWIQWVSVYTGKDAKTHNILRLGDYDQKNKQIFKILEDNNFKVGAITPMNAYNDLKEPAYFFPDPWSDTFSDGNKFDAPLYKTISKLVKDNSSKKISLNSFFIFLFYFIYYFRVKNLFNYIYLIFGYIFFQKNWNRSLFLDLFLNDIHFKKQKKYKPNFSSLFLNAGAHIQHHYFFNMIDNINLNPEWYIAKNKDPSKELFKIYNSILSDYLKPKSNYDILIVTGLSQTPCEKPFFYYRLKNHQNFLKKFNIKFKKLLPRMTRDFTILLNDKIEAREVEQKLMQFKDENNNKLFDIIDNRGDSLFVTLTLSNQIKKSDKFYYKNELIDIYDDLVFVAIKNGIHNTNGYLYTNMKLNLKHDKIHISETFNILKKYFEIK